MRKSAGWHKFTHLVLSSCYTLCSVQRGKEKRRVCGGEGEPVLRAGMVNNSSHS